MATRWDDTDAPRGEEYDARWARLAATGQNIHGEADLVDSLLGEFGGERVLDAGCGTGRVAIELHRRGFHVVGVDADEPMLATARHRDPSIAWIHGDLVELASHVDERFDAAVLAGNVMIFVDPGTEGTVIDQICGRLEPPGLLIAGFQVNRHRLPLATYDEHAERNGCELIARWSTWQRDAYAGGDYAVSVHRRAV